MTNQRRLGRGLEALLSRVAGAPDAPGATPDAEPSQTVAAGQPAPSPSDPPESTPSSAQTLPISRIDGNPFQPRRDFDEAELASLSQSLRSHGLLQPVVVRAHGDRFQLVAGERRLRAAAAAGWAEVPVKVIAADDRQMAELAIVENMQRKDLNALEKAASFQRYLQQYGCTQEDLAKRIEMDRSTIANLIRLLELPEAVQDAIRQGKITPGHARALLPLGDEREQIAFSERIQREGMSVRQTERDVQEAIAEADAEPLGVVGRDGKSTKPRRLQSEHVAALEQEFKSALGSKVRITHSGRGRGKIAIAFATHEEFERLRRHICAPAVPAPQTRAS